MLARSCAHSIRPFASSALCARTPLHSNQYHLLPKIRGIFCRRFEVFPSRRACMGREFTAFPISHTLECLLSGNAAIRTPGNHPVAECRRMLHVSGCFTHIGLRCFAEAPIAPRRQTMGLASQGATEPYMTRISTRLFCHRPGLRDSSLMSCFSPNGLRTGMSPLS